MITRTELTMTSGKISPVLRMIDPDRPVLDSGGIHASVITG